MVTNKNYRRFLDDNIIQTLTEDQIKEALNNVTGKNTRQGQALLITMYYTGARPNEVLDMRGKDIMKEDSYVVFKMSASKGGLPRSVYLPYRKELAKIIYNYSMGVFPDMFLFYNFRSNYIRYMDGKERKEISNNLRYYFNKWFKSVIDGGIPPYFLRHNRFSRLAERGISMDQIKILKGAKDISSVTPYLHLSTKTSKDIAKKMD